MKKEQKYRVLFNHRVFYVRDHNGDGEKKVLWGKIFGEKRNEFYVGEVVKFWKTKKGDDMITKHYPRKFYKVKRIKGTNEFRIINRNVNIDDLGRDSTGLADNKNYL